MCSILSLSPVEVDCDDKWLFVFYDEKFIKTPYGIEAMGYSWYEEQRKYGVKPILIVGHMIDAGIGSGIKGPDGVPIIWHEIRHLMCECSWHD